MLHNKKIFGVERNIFFAGMVSLFMDMSSEMIYPLVPLFLASVLGVNKSLIGLIEGIAESTASILKVFSGWLSDRLGNRKYLMLTGYAVSTLSRPVIAGAGMWQHVLAGRFVDRLGKGIRTAPRDAIIAESSATSRLARSFGFHRAMDTMGAVIGPLIALGILQIFTRNYRLVFWLSMVPGVLAVLTIVFFISEKRKEPAPSHPEQKKARLPRLDRQVKFFIAIATLFALGNSSDAFLILKAQQAGIAAGIIPAVYLTFNLIYAAASIPAGMAADRFGMKKIILLGFVLFSGLYYGFARACTPVAVWTLFSLYGVFMGLTEGIQKAFLATIIPPDARATAFGIFSTAVGLAMLPASLIAGWLWDRISPAAAFYYGSATAALSAVLFIVMIGLMRKQPLNHPDRAAA